MQILNNIATALILLGLFGTWWFIKKNPNKKFKWTSIVVTVIAFVLFGISDTGGNKEATNTPQSSSTTSKSSLKNSSSISETETSKVKKKTETSSSSSKQKDDQDKDENGLPYITADKMPDFIAFLEQDLTEKGLDISEYTFENKDTALYVYVPNDYKYYDKKDLQAFSDGLQEKIHGSFNVWSGTNGISYERYPMLYIKTDSNDSIASESAWSGDMKLKVK